MEALATFGHFFAGVGLLPMELAALWFESICPKKGP